MPNNESPAKLLNPAEAVEQNRILTYVTNLKNINMAHSNLASLSQQAVPNGLTPVQYIDLVNSSKDKFSEIQKQKDDILKAINETQNMTDHLKKMSDDYTKMENKFESIIGSAFRKSGANLNPRVLENGTTK